MIKLAVEFEVEESSPQPLQEFQKAGHFVPAMKDENGFRRTWNGSSVFALTLYSIRKDVPPLQTIRIVADDPVECEILMAKAIKDTVFANWANQQQDAFDRAQWLELNERRNQFREFLNLHYSREIERGEHRGFKDVFDAAVFYMRKERSSLSRRIARMLRREPATERGSDWMPQEWRG